MDELQQGDRLVGKGDKWEAQGERKHHGRDEIGTGSQEGADEG